MEQVQSNEQKTYNFKMTYVTQTGHVWHKFAEKFGEELVARSDGRMKLELFPAAQLGPEKDMVQQLENGSIDFALITLAYLSSRIPAVDAWNMPFLFPNLETAIEATDSEPAKKILQLFDEQGLLGKGYMLTPPHNLLIKDSPIDALDDVNGMKVRFTGGPSVLEYWEGLGASPIAMGLPEVYSALQTGVIDGVSIDTNALLSEKLYEEADYYVLTNHMAFGSIFTASKVNFEKMPAEDQKIVDEALAAALDWGKKELVKIQSEDLKQLESLLNVSELTTRDAFREEAKKIYEKYSSENELIKEFIESIPQ